MAGPARAAGCRLRHAPDRGLDEHGPRGANIVRNSTIFSEVAFGQGKVVTGWTFESNASERPVAENCHYAEHAGVNKVDPGERGAG